MKKYLLIFALLVIAATACNRVDESESNFDNQVYIQEAQASNLESIILAPSDSSLERSIQASLALPTDKDVSVSYHIDGSMVERYNKVNAAACEVLPADYYELPETNATIPAGSVRSSKIAVKFKNLADLPSKTTFLLPVSIASSSEAIMDGSRTMYYALKKGALIVVAADLSNTFLALTDAANSTLKGLGAVTIEVLMNVSKWRESTDEAGISTLLGIEGTFLLRIGDNGFPNSQLQIAKGAGLGGNFPASDESKKLKAEQWIHLAVTFDLAGTHELAVYVNGKTQSKAVQSISSTTLDLAPTSGKRFLVGTSWNTGRRLQGMVSEMRIWSKVRSLTELNEGKYGVPTDSEGLQAYWKFNEGTGNFIHDYTGHGNDLQADPPKALSDLDWTGTTGIVWKSVELGLE